MKKSNKITALYIIFSLLLFVTLVAGGIYGVYVSIGVNFARSTISDMTGDMSGGVRGYSYGGTLNFESSMVGVIILSIALIVIAIFDLISLIKQVVLFKQFKVVSESKIEQKIEKKVKSKGAVIFFAVLVDILSLLAGIAGIFINSNSFVASNISWVLYLVDGFVALFSVISLVLLIIKLKKVKKLPPQKENEGMEGARNFDKAWFGSGSSSALDIDDVETKLLKLRHLKSCKLITEQEYTDLRDRVIGVKTAENDDKKVQKD